MAEACGNSNTLIGTAHCEAQTHGVVHMASHIAGWTADMDSWRPVQAILYVVGGRADAR